MEEKEIWKDIQGYEGYYQVSNFGRTKSLERKAPNGRIVRSRILAIRPNNRNYLIVDLCKDSIKKSYLVHRLVAKTFLSNLNNLEQVNHKDCNKQNNYLNNLEFCTNLENYRHGWANGCFESITGSNCHAAKLTDEQVREIRKKRKIYKYSLKELSEEFGVNESVISRIANGILWKHLEK